MSKIKKGGLDQYGGERFGRLMFDTIRKKCGTERVNCQSNRQCTAGPAADIWLLAAVVCDRHHMHDKGPSVLPITRIDRHCRPICMARNLGAVYI